MCHVSSRALVSFLPLGLYLQGELFSHFHLCTLQKTPNYLKQLATVSAKNFLKKTSFERLILVCFGVVRQHPLSERINLLVPTPPAKNKFAHDYLLSSLCKLILDYVLDQGHERGIKA